MSISCLRAAAAILLAGPTRIGTMIPSLAASAAPRNEVSSHGCTTTVVAGGTCLARLMRRSYLAWVCTTGAACVFAITKLLGWSQFVRPGSRRFSGFFAPPLRQRHGGWRLDTKQPGNALESLGGFARDLSARTHHLAEGRKGLAAQLAIRRQQLGNCRKCRLLVDQQHEKLLADEGLEIRQRQAWLVVVDGAQAADGGNRAFVDAAACHADVEHAAGEAFAQASLGDVRPQFGNAGVQQLAMQPALSGPALRARIGRIDADGRLQR